MLDEIFILETPPLTSCYCRVGEQACVPITGSHGRRVLHGAINIQTGDVVLLVTDTFNHSTHQTFLHLIRSHWRGWQIVLFEDRAKQHTAYASRELATNLNIQIRLLPKATPELNAMDHLWRHTTRDGLANHPTITMDQSAEAACQYIRYLSPCQRLRKAGVLSGNFWLAK